MSSPCERRKSSVSAPPPTIVSRHPRLPQRHMWPRSSTETCPSSPAIPRAPRYRRPPRISPPPMPEDSITYAISVASRPAPSTDSASAPRLASLSTSTRTPRRSLSHDPTSMSTQPGRIVDELTCPVARSIGPDSATPAPTSLSRSTPASASRQSTSSAAVLRPAWASWSTSACRAPSARIVSDRSAIATRTKSWSNWMPITAPAPGSSDSISGGRPPEAALAACTSSRSTTSPARWSSPTSVETVERARPVADAICERLTVPRSRTTSSTLSRFSSRSELSDPTRPRVAERPPSILPKSTIGDHLRSGTFCQDSIKQMPTFGRIDPEV